MGSGAAAPAPAGGCEHQASAVGTGEPWIRASLCDRALLPSSVCHRGGTSAPAGREGIHPRFGEIPNS